MLVAFIKIYIVMKNWFKLLRISIYKCSARLCGVLCVIFIFMIVACCFLQWTKPQYEKFYFNNFVVMEPNNLNKREKIYIDKLIAKNRIIPIDEIYGKTLSYYDSLISVLTIFIAVLTTLLGLLAFTSWFSLKAKVRNDVQEIKHGLKGEIDTEIQKVVSSEFYKTWLTTEVFGKYIAENKDKLFPDASNVNIDQLINDIIERIKQDIKDNKKEIKLPENLEEGD